MFHSVLKPPFLLPSTNRQTYLSVAGAVPRANMDTPLVSVIHRAVDEIVVCLATVDNELSG